jgi:hypothetical protein
MSKREPQTILKTDERSIHLEVGRERKFNRQIKRLAWKPGFLEGDKLEVAVKNGNWGADPSAGPTAPAPPPGAALLFDPRVTPSRPL